MKRIIRYGIVIPACVVALWFIFQFGLLVWVLRQFDRLEQNAKKAISGTELQRWATNLLAQYQTNDPPSSLELSKACPKPLLGLYRRPPYVQINEGQGEEHPASVFVMWGGGFIGHCGFEIGPTNFVSYRSNAREWQPGVYFWSDEPRK